MKKSPKKPVVVSSEVTPAPRSNGPLRMISKAEVLRRVPVTFPTIWNMMRAEPPKFPRSRTLGGKSAWLEDDIENWIASQPESVFKKKTEEA